MHALTQLLFSASKLSLPLQQSCPANGFGEVRQLIAELWGDTGEFRSIWSSGHQHEIPQDPCHALKNGSGITAAVKQLTARFQQRHGLTGAHGLHQLQQLLLRNRSQQIPYRSGFDRSR